MNEKFISYLPKEAFDIALTSYFRAMGVIYPTMTLEFDAIAFQDDKVRLEANLKEETLN